MSDPALAADAADTPATPDTLDTRDAPASRSRRLMAGAEKLAPGLALTAAIALGAYGLRYVPGVSILSPLILAILIGMLLHNAIGTPLRAKAGVAFSMRRILRFAIVLLGLQITAQQVVEIGGTGAAIVTASLAATFLFTKALGRLMGIERKLAELIAAGTSICGASAVIATNTVTDGSDEDVAYAVACVTVFGTISMFLYPLLGTAMGLAPHPFGLWAGASIHEIAQVVAAAFQHGTDAGEFGTIAKLSRVMLLAPVVGLLGFAASRRRDGETPSQAARRAPPIPWFVVGFIALIGVNSFGIVPADAKAVLVPATVFMLAMALAAMGLETDIRKLRAMGLAPLALGFFASVFISAFSLALVLLLG
ncbi:Putative membrane protein YeiH [Rhodovulum sp. PH10]|uniref:YeiH family protein n=1 Tax=Rhodovulum sp. PH10 TaxID=1187851 RepID=UPI00027C1E54|nr:YeiH family protein [Rhodovulum sp. PH10]EJW11472.1 Putative membrane protein YeiH [Rhodovulum sp. PH10]